MIFPLRWRDFQFLLADPPVSSPHAFPDPLQQVHPQYSSARALDATLEKVSAEADDFLSEKYHDRIAPVLSELSRILLRSPKSMPEFQSALTADFLGSSPTAEESRLLRDRSGLQVKRKKFAQETALLSGPFLLDLQDSLSEFDRIRTAEFQITNISAGANSSSPNSTTLRTRVRYEMVGEGKGFHREQRVGEWEMEWSVAPSNRILLRRWQMLHETVSRSFSPIFHDIAPKVFGSTASYSAQLMHGVDYWRTVLDGACGIDLYGHNGVSVADIDNDGLDDLYVCQPAGLPNRLYRNRGDGTLEDVTAASGLGLLENTACALFADFNNDGIQDVILVGASGPKYFLGLGGGKFRYRPGAFQFATPPQGTFTGAAVADYDRDGWLDIYFCLYVYYQGSDQYKYPVPYHDANNGPPNFLMRNHRDETFRDVTAQCGLNQNNTRYSFCCGWNDYNHDGWPDLYVVNDFGRKNLYRNHGDGTFTDVAAEMGVEDVGAGMGVAWLDYDNDGMQDLYVSDMWTAAGERISTQEQFQQNAAPETRAEYRKHAMGNSLFRNGGGLFQDRSELADVRMGRWAWSSDAFDFDHDGFPDLYIVNGMVSGTAQPDLNSFFWRQVVAKSPDQPKPSQEYEQGWSAINELIRSDGTWSGYERNVFYANNGDGTFTDVSGAVGLDFIEDGRAFALADFDGDGRQEIFLKNRNGPQLRVLKNCWETLPPALAFRLTGTKSNRDAIGAEVTIETEVGRQTRTLQAGSGFLSQHSKELFFGLGESKGTLKATIRWPSGLRQEFREIPPNHRVFVEEAHDNLRVEPFRARSTKDSGRAGAIPQDAETLPRDVQTWLLAPVAAPEISSPDLYGHVRNMAEFRGKPLLLSFWSVRSDRCLNQVERIARAKSRWGSLGLLPVAVVADLPNGPEEIKKIALQRRIAPPVLLASNESIGVYNLLYRYLFDRHRDMALPTSFLIDAEGQIVKIYQGIFDAELVATDVQDIPINRAQRLNRALPFAGVSETYEFARNHLSFGSIYFQRGYYAQAGVAFQSAVDDDPKSAEAYYGLGSAWLKQDKIAEARRSFERAIQLQASYPDTLANAWNNLGLLDTQENRTEEAVRCFQQALRSSPENLIALNNLGNAYRLRKNWEEARQTFQRALAIEPNDAEANYGLAMVFANSDDAQHAYEHLQRALQSRPNYPEALNNLGILYLRTGQRELAVKTFDQCIGIAPAFDQSYLNLAKLYALEGAPEKARAILLDLLKRHPDHAAAKSMLAQLDH